MTTYRYKSDAVVRDIVLKSAIFSFVVGLAVNIPVAVVIIAVSSIAGCYERSDYIQALAVLPAIHTMVFILTFGLMCGMFIVIRNSDEAGAEKK